MNLGTSKRGNYNMSCNDVVWSPNDENLIATGATNGAVVLWNLGITGKSKQERVFEDHKRTINKVGTGWHLDVIWQVYLNFMFLSST